MCVEKFQLMSSPVYSIKHPLNKPNYVEIPY